MPLVPQRLLDAETWILHPLRPGQRPSGRAAVRISAGIWPWGLGFGVAFAVLQQPLLAGSLGLAAVGVGATPLVLRGSRSLSVTAHWMNLFLAQSLLVPAWLLGGLVAACVPWLGLCIVTATFLAGPRAGAVWGGLSVAAVAGLWGAHAVGVLPPEVVPDPVIWGLAFGAHAGLFSLVWVVATVTSWVAERRAEQLLGARQAADRANAAKSAFLAKMSHELRTPMNAVIGYAELLEEDALPAQQDDLRRIVDAGQHLLALLNDVLDLSKVEAGQMAFRDEVVTVHPLAVDVMTAARPLLDAGGNTAEVTVDDDLTVRADALRLRQCLLNLVSNAAKFTRSGQVAVRARRDGDGVCIEVEDTGAGIAAEALPTLFDPFVQAHDEHSGPHGTGLGLALVKQFVERMGGRVEVRSTLGQGSCFGVWLPAA